MRMTEWRKSSYSAAQTDCVEIGRGIGIRDSKTSGHLLVSASAWSAFLVGVKSGLDGHRTMAR
jgi:hypothetical protein